MSIKNALLILAAVSLILFVVQVLNEAAYTGTLSVIHKVVVTVLIVLLLANPTTRKSTVWLFLGFGLLILLTIGILFL
ncbi:MAG: hypothetical protein J5I94_06815 [Phaeodactylibacter sp.]|nr:hypothetical protein [Phaeodactylibacter sp.]